MKYKLYTFVDITNTGKHKPRPGQDMQRWKEQNFQTVLQTLGIRSNITWDSAPVTVEMSGALAGFDTDNIVRLWRFDFYTERDDLWLKDQDQCELLREDFELVPYISGLDELLKQSYAVFIPFGPNRNITFFVK